MITALPQLTLIRRRLLIKLTRIAVVLLVFIGLGKTAAAQQMPFIQDVDSAKLKEVPLPPRPLSRRQIAIAENKKRPGRALIEFIGAELTPFVIDNNIRQVDYTHISWNTVGHNLKPSSWEWDNDNFQTNQFGHPYHGSLFFSAYRANGYSFWQAAPAAMVGSYLWETFAENQAPAPNDFINTSFGGVVLGEMTYRLANKIVNNNKQRGAKHIATEIFGLLINPMNGLNRLMDGKWTKYNYSPADRDSSKITAEFDIGLRKFSVGNNNPLHDGHFGWYGRARLLYGSPYQDYRKPFSNISIMTEFGKDDSTVVNTLSVYGSLAGWPIRSNGRFQHLAILSANYDYIHNSAFFYGGQSVNINLYSKMEPINKLQLNTALSAGAILLAAIPSQYLYHGRNYDYGPGLSVSGSGGLNVADKFFYSINYRGGWIKTINGNSSHYFLHAITNEVSYRFANNISLCAESGYFFLNGHYSTRPQDTKRYPYLRFSVRYTLNP
ncbi:MAG: DUF3943 domain-containing protein [Mucilaginibacter sp.]